MTYDLVCPCGYNIRCRTARERALKKALHSKVNHPNLVMETEKTTYTTSGIGAVASVVNTDGKVAIKVPVRRHLVTGRRAARAGFCASGIERKLVKT